MLTVLSMLLDGGSNPCQLPPPLQPCDPASHLCSAKTRDGVQEAFQELVHKVLQVPSLYSVEGSRDTVDPLASQPPAEESWCGGSSCTVT